MPTPLKSPEEHFLQGTPVKRATPTESYVRGSRPKFPKSLSAGGRRVFKMLCALLEERRAITRADAEPLRLYCILHERHARAVAALEAEGEITTYTRLDSNGKPHPQVKTNLWLPVAIAAEKQMVSILMQLGLTPSARDKVKPTASAATKTEAQLAEEAIWKPRELSRVIPMPPPELDENDSE